MKTALTNKLAALGARSAEYGGVETAASFGDVDAEFQALTQGCGVFDLGWRARIVVRGEDRVRWLNGMVTNNVRDLAPNEGNYNFVLSPQGRIQGDLYAYNRADHLVIETDVAQLPALTKFLEHYIIMDDVTLELTTDTVSAIGIQGARAAEVLATAGLTPLNESLTIAGQDCGGVGVSLVRMPDGTPSYELWLATGHAGSIWEDLVRAGATPVGFEAVEKYRVLAGIPKYGQDIRAKDLPQETSQERALHFNKGCYVGQEIVERIRSRGAVHRSLSGFVLHGPAERGMKVVGLDHNRCEKEIGELTSVASIPIRGMIKIIGLGIVRHDGIEPGTHCRIGTTEAMAEELPFKY